MVSDNTSDSTAPEPPSRDPFRDHFPDGRGYSYRRFLGGGGVALVYEAWDPRKQRVVAIKVLNPGKELDHLFLEREASWLAKVQHSCIAAFYDYQRGDPPFIVMEYVEGRDLADLLRSEGRLTLKRACAICLDLGRGLQYLHDLERELRHFDVKCANLIVGPDDRAKIIDLGMAGARWLPVSAESSTVVYPARERPSGWTKEYAAPEILNRDWPNVDKRADIWSFGCVLWECLAGRRPFSGNNPENAESWVPPVHVLPELPPVLREFLLRCLERDPRDRLRDIGDVCWVLESIVSPAAVRAPRAPAMPSNAPAAPPTGFIDREEDLAELWAMVTEDRAALVLVYGLPGSGKTRLVQRFAQAVERELVDDVEGLVWVSLKDVRVPSKDLDGPRQAAVIEDAVRRSLQNVTIADRRDPVPQVEGTPFREWMRRRRILVVLDDLQDHEVAVSAFAGGLEGGSSTVVAIATRNAMVGVPTIRLGGLRLPRLGERAWERILQSSAGELFVLRARAAEPAFPTAHDDPAITASIVHRLAGLPLFIEAVASLRAGLSLEEIHERLERLMTQADPSLDAAFAACIAALPEAERVLLERLSLFRGGWTLRAAEAVCADEPTDVAAGHASSTTSGIEIYKSLRGLVNAAMIVRDPRTKRYDMSEPLREHVVRHLRRTEAADDGLLPYRRRCLEFLADLAANRSDGPGKLAERELVVELSAEIPQMCEALRSAERDPDAFFTAVRLLRASSHFWWVREEESEVLPSYQWAVRHVDRLEPAEWRVHLLNAAGMVATRVDPIFAEGCFRTGRRLIDSDRDLWRFKPALWSNWGLLEKEQNRLDTAAEYQRLALAFYEEGHASDPGGHIADQLRLNLAVTEKLREEPDEAHRLLEGLGDRFEARHDHSRVANVLQSLGEIAASTGRLDEARRMLLEARRRQHRLGHAGYTAHAVLWLGIVEAKAGRLRRAAVLLTHGERMFLRSYRSMPEFHARPLREAWALVQGAR